MPVEYRVIRSDRRTLSLEITTEGELLVRVPRRVSEHQIRQFVDSNRGWIEIHYHPKPPVVPFTAEEVLRIKEQARSIFLPRVRLWAERMGVQYQGVTVRMQRSKWGSCNAQGHLNLNALLVLFPEWVMDYVIVHELAHCREHNHSRRFWMLVETAMPHYKQARQWLKEQGADLIRRIPR